MSIKPLTIISDYVPVPVIEVLTCDDPSMPKKFAWLQYVQGTNLADHCKKSLLGYTSKALPFHGIRHIANLELDEATAKYYYLFFMDTNYRWQYNFHLAFYAGEGTIYYQHAGIFCIIRNAVRVPIEPVNFETLDKQTYDLASPHRHNRDYTTCRNWQFAVAMYQNMTAKEREYNDKVIAPGYKTAKPAPVKHDTSSTDVMAELFDITSKQEFTDYSREEVYAAIPLPSITFLQENCFQPERYFADPQAAKTGLYRLCQLITAMQDKDTTFYYQKQDGNYRRAVGRLTGPFSPTHMNGMAALRYWDVEVGGLRCFNIYHILTTKEYEDKIKNEVLNLS